MSDAAPDPVTCTIEDGVAVVRLDDGKVNVISHRVIELLHAALDRSLEEATAVAIIGREGKLSAGFDLTEMTAGIERTQALVGAGRPPAHAHLRAPAAGGARRHRPRAGRRRAARLSCDVRIGGDGPAKIGLNETAIGMGLPHYAVELAEERLARAHLRRGAVQAEIYDAAGAVEAGYLDRVVPAAEVERADDRGGPPARASSPARRTATPSSPSTGRSSTGSTRTSTPTWQASPRPALSGRIPQYTGQSGLQVSNPSADLPDVDLTAGAAAWARRDLGCCLPRGPTLPYSVWWQRHRGILVLLWLHVPVGVRRRDRPPGSAWPTPPSRRARSSVWPPWPRCLGGIGA